jgi:hypothetical protein
VLSTDEALGSSDAEQLRGPVQHKGPLQRDQFRPAARKPRKLSPDAITKAIQLAQTEMS